MAFLPRTADRVWLHSFAAIVPPLIEAFRALGCGTSTGGDMFTAVAQLIVDFLLADGPLAGR